MAETESAARWFVAASITPALRRAAAVVRDRVRLWAAADAPQIQLWTPVAIGIGALIYFFANVEPPRWTGAVAALATLGPALRASSRRSLFAAFFLVALGFAAAQLRTAMVDAPALKRDTPAVWITGRVLSVEQAVAGRRLLIDVESIESLAEAESPARVRLTWRGKESAVSPGDVIRIRARLSPPPEPVAPGGYDFSRQLFFEGIGGVGFAISPPEIMAPRQSGAARGLAEWAEALRTSVANRIMTEAPGQGGAIVAAVITGKRGAVDEHSRTALQDSGLAHLLAISGLHMGLATGLIFFFVRGALALNETTALTWPIKKIAAVAALAAGLAYLALSGGGWSAQRAFIMTALVFVAIIFDRRALSLRTVAVAASLILLVAPQAILSPGFQMSFAAVTGLIAFYEWSAARADPDRNFGLLHRAGRYVIGIVVTDTIAAAATAPFGIFHFNQNANYGFAANLLAIPVMGFWVMPAAIVGLLLAPVGADAWAWRLAAAGVELFLAWGKWVAALPGAVSIIAQWSPATLGALTLCGLWMCLMRAPWRLGGLALAPFAFVFTALARPPDLYVLRDGDNFVAVTRKAGEDAMHVANPRSDRFTLDVLAQMNGRKADREGRLPLPDIGACDSEGCVVAVKGLEVAVSRRAPGLVEDCARAPLVIALYPVDRRLRDQCSALLIDRRDAWNAGAHAIWIEPGGAIRVQTVAATRGERPWSRNSSR